MNIGNETSVVLAGNALQTLGWTRLASVRAVLLRQGPAELVLVTILWKMRLKVSNSLPGPRLLQFQL